MEVRSAESRRIFGSYNPNFLEHVNEKICEIKRHGIKTFDDNTHTYSILFTVDTKRYEIFNDLNYNNFSRYTFLLVRFLPVNIYHRFWLF